MPTLKPALTITGTQADFGDALALSVTKSLTNVTQPIIGVSQKSIATGSAQDLIAACSAMNYTYIEVVSGANATDWLQVKLGGTAMFKVRVGEFAFFPLYNGVAITAEAQGGACVVRYAQWAATS